MSLLMEPRLLSVPADATPTRPAAQAPDRHIGDIVRESHRLTADQVERVLAHQRSTGLRFGEAAIALGLLDRDQVLWALSQQFSYPYAPTPQSLPELVVSHSPFSEHAESFRELRSQLLSAVFSDEAPRRALAVVSPDVGDGKTYFAANIAVAFNQLMGRTLLIDADFRNPRLARVFNYSEPGGLSNFLIGRGDISLIRPIEELPNLFVLPVGVVPPNPQELVQRPTFRLLLKELIEKFDYVVVDTPAAVHGADARTIAAACGAAIVVGRRGRSRVKALRQLTGSMRKLDALVAGVVVNEYRA
jgi:chain length determinant protein tyrosine kinase EpsG